MKWCVLSNCPSNNLSYKDKLSVPHYLFPRDPKYCKLWIKFCDNSEFCVRPAIHRICAQHFTPDQFQRDLKSELLKLNSKPKLKSTAIPTIEVDYKKDELQESVVVSDTLVSIDSNTDPPHTSLPFEQFSYQYENRKLKRQVHALKLKVLGLERLNAAFREENKNLKMAVIEAERNKQPLTNVEDVLVLPGYTVVLYK